MALPITKRIRLFAAYFWSLGLFAVAFDQFNFVSIQDTNISSAYLFFFLASGFCWWAEIREFGLRIVLYRLHDLATGAPWHFLLLYFLWVNLFAPFTEYPVLSVIYACGGWFSFIAIAFSAQLVFCERSERGIILIAKLLRIPFWFYNLAVIVLSTEIILTNIWKNGWFIEQFYQNTIDVSLYFCIGLPFIIWDFINPKRKMAPRWITGISTIGILSSLFLLQQKYFIGATILSALGILALGIYKRIRVHRPLAYLFFLCLLGINLVFVYSQHTWRKAIVAKQEILWQKVWLSLKTTHFLGAGIGSSVVGDSSIDRGIWIKILLEVGIMGIILYGLFFISILKSLFFIRRSEQIVISNISIISVLIFLVVASHFARNPYSASIWVWYAMWAIFASSHQKRENA